MLRSPSFDNKVAVLDLSSKQIVTDVEKIVNDILDGYCPIELDNVWVFFENTTNINAKNAVKILCNFPTPVLPTPEAVLLEKLCTMSSTKSTKQERGEARSYSSPSEVSASAQQLSYNQLYRAKDDEPMSEKVIDWSPTVPSSSSRYVIGVEDIPEVSETLPGMGTDLERLKNTGCYATMEEAVPALVELAIHHGLANLEDYPALFDKFSRWLSGRTWQDCEASGIDGTLVYPWNYNSYLYTCLMTDLLGENMTVVFKNDKPVDLVGEEHAVLFQLLWSFSGGLCEDVEATTVKAMTLGFHFNQQIISRERRMKMVKAKSMHSRKQRASPTDIVCSGKCTVS